MQLLIVYYIFVMLVAAIFICLLIYVFVTIGYIFLFVNVNRDSVVSRGESDTKNQPTCEKNRRFKKTDTSSIRYKPKFEINMTDSANKPKVDLGLLEEDDEFEEFPTEDWTGKDEDEEDISVWEDNWDDDNIEDDFSIQLRAELEKQGMKQDS